MARHHTTTARARVASPRPATKLSWSLLLAFVVVALTTPASLASPNLARLIDDDLADLSTDEFINVVEDIGAGTCTPEEAAIEQVITCRFELVGNATTIDDFTTLHAALVDLEQFAGGRCLVEGRELVCPDVPVPFEQGSFGITLYPLAANQPLATASVVRTVDGVLGLSLVTRRVPTFLAGVESSIGTFRSFALAADIEAELLLRRQGDDEIVARVPALPAGSDTGEALLTIPGPGRWTLTGCVPEADGSCRIEGIRRPIHAIDPRPLPLVPGHNGPTEDRINLVFAGSGFGPDDDLVDVATTLLALDGQPTPIDAGTGSDVFALDWGPFAIEPMLGQADRFNFWYLADDLPGGPIVVSPNGQFPSQIDEEDFGLGSRISIITISRNGFADGFRANAELASFADDETLPELADVRFGSVYLPYDQFGVGTATTLAHEFGHSLFGLRDEYEEFDAFEPTIGLPNCAATTDEAEALWGDLIGELDPMYERWRTAMTEADLWFEERGSEDDFTVGLVTGGCFGPPGNTDAVRPTVRGLMNGEEPVFGAVNRAQVEAVLDLFPEPPPPPPPTTTTSAPTTTTEAEVEVEVDPTIETESELGSESLGSGGSGALPIAIAAGAVAVVVGLATILLLRRRR